MTDSRRPNVLWLCIDDFAYSACSAYDNAVAWTPNLERLAKEGMRFDRAYCNCPLSTPSRQSFLTGRYPWSMGVTLSRTQLPDDEVTIATHMRSAGYQTAAIGKTHYYHPRAHESDVCVDLPDYREWLRAKGRESLPPGMRVLGPWNPFRDPVAAWLNAAVLPQGLVDGDMSGTFLANKARDFLCRKHEQPFFLFVSFYETHAPFHFPIEFRGRCNPEEVVVPAPGSEDAAWLPVIFRDLTVEQKQGIIASYCTSAQYADKNIGLVLEALDISGERDRTLVIFTSDHGYSLGQHGRFEKHCCLEPAVRVPMLLRLPGTIPAGASTEALVELVDVLPTVAGLCGVAVPDNIQGVSLVPLLHGETTRHRDHVVSHYADNAEGMIRTGRWKLIYRNGTRVRRDHYAESEAPPGPSMRLYDMENDPNETTDLAGRVEHAALVHSLARRLADRFRDTMGCGQIPATDEVDSVLAYCLVPHDDRKLRRVSWARRKDNLPRGTRVLALEYDEQTVVVYRLDWRPSPSAPPEAGARSCLALSLGWTLFRCPAGAQRHPCSAKKLRLTHYQFHQLLLAAVPSLFDPRIHASREEWQAALRGSDVRYEWQPDRDWRGVRVPGRRTLVIMSGRGAQGQLWQALPSTGPDLAECFNRHALDAATTAEPAGWPDEREYDPPDAVRGVLGMFAPPGGDPLALLW